MTPAEKARQLVISFKPHAYYDAHDLTTRSQREKSILYSAKECAEICVNEIIELYRKQDGPEGTSYLNSGKYFWMQVKK